MTLTSSTSPESRDRAVSESGDSVPVPPKFWQGSPKLYSRSDTAAAIRYIKRYASLERVFETHALGHVAAMENSLVIDESLERTDRVKIRSDLKRLEAPGRTLWENWIWQSPLGHHHKFDLLVSEWRRSLSQP